MELRKKVTPVECSLGVSALEAYMVLPTVRWCSRIRIGDARAPFNVQRIRDLGLTDWMTLKNGSISFPVI